MGIHLSEKEGGCPMGIRKRDKMKLFVFGTLKKGFRNHKYLGEAVFLRNDVTLAEFDLVETTTGDIFPICKLGINKIRGEVYEVSDRDMEKVDWLESYFNIKREISLESGEKALLYVWKLDLPTLLSCKVTPMIPVDGIYEWIKK
jgi:gamma-glutamylcyclotransferase (GGCT)/AIG2-like uncharacterized protein YtfP